MNTSEPPYKRRKVQNGVKTGGGSNPRISLAETCLLARWHPAYRWHDLDLGPHVELREPVVAMKREMHKQRSCKADSIEALHRDGQIRSSEEAAVIAVERRDLVIQLSTIINWEQEE